MIGILEIKGKQYFIDKEKATLKVDRLDLKEKSAYKDIKVLYFKDKNGNVHIGQPYVKNAFVKATVEKKIKAEKILIRRYKPKSGYEKSRGHRQKLTTLKIEEISLS